MKLVFQLNKSVEFIFDHLTDMQKFVSVHPVIYKIENSNKGHYKIHEKLNFGFIPFSFTYTTTVESNDSKNQVIYQANVMKLIAIKFAFVLKSKGATTIVEENIDIKSILPVKGIMNSIFEKHHGQLFKNIGGL